MKLISTTLAGPGTEGIIGDALRSVARLVDACVVTWTGPSEDAVDGGANWTANEACHSALADMLVYLMWRSWVWQSDFAAARNVALANADDERAETRVSWALMLDTDERVLCPDPSAVRAFLAALPPEVEVVVAHAADGSHSRERFFRLPAKHRWIGRTHEAFHVEHGQQAIIQRELITWTELSKTPEQLFAKNERDALLLMDEIAEHPDDPRWRFYLGGALGALGHVDDAVEAYREAAERGRGEDSALACARAAELLIEAKRYEEAVAACARGMTIRPDLAELPWLAAGASLNAGEPMAAEAWALLAQVHGEAGAGRGALARRVSYRSTRALREGPGEILSLARAAMRGRRPEVHITVTSTALNAEAFVSRCIASVAGQSIADPHHAFVAADPVTYHAARASSCGLCLVSDGTGRGLLENLLPVWRSLPDDDVIVWLDGDDWLASDDALAIVAEAHRDGALATYGSFMTADGRPVLTGPCGADPRHEPWRLSHLKSFRAGLVKKIRDEDLRGPDGRYVELGIDRAVMLPIVEMAAERARWIDRILCVYNTAHSFEANATPEQRAREAAEVARIHALPRYSRI